MQEQETAVRVLILRTSPQRSEARGDLITCWIMRACVGTSTLTSPAFPPCREGRLERVAWVQRQVPPTLCHCSTCLDKERLHLHRQPDPARSKNKLTGRIPKRAAVLILHCCSIYVALYCLETTWFDYICTSVFDDLHGNWHAVQIAQLLLPKF